MNKESKTSATDTEGRREERFGLSSVPFALTSAQQVLELGKVAAVAELEKAASGS